MNRRKFVHTMGLSGIGLAIGSPVVNSLLTFKDAIIGHGSHQYKIDLKWGALDANLYPVNDCHEMVQDSKGRIVLLTNHTKNNVIVYDRSGKLIEVWGTEYPGAHGLTLNSENGEDFLYITDTQRNEVIKTTMKGQEVQTFRVPKRKDLYKEKGQYQPTETAIHSNGDVYIADGYGEQHILHYNAKGELLNAFGGKGEGDDKFQNAHGICIDKRDSLNPTLLITAREQNRLKKFSLDGVWIENIELPGAYICRPVIHNDHVYLATIWSGDKAENSGFVSILDKDNRLISAPGGSVPRYNKGVLEPMHQALKLFKHPHDVCVDEDENLYVAQWNSGKSYPIKLIRI